MEVTEDGAQALAGMAGLELPPARITSLARAFGQFLTQFEGVRAIDKGDREPGTINWEREARDG